jgi:uncharacterized damage-inducible protein DinB
MPELLSLAAVFDGWDTYNTSIVRAVAPLTQSQLRFQPAPGLRSVGETASHIGLGRIDWFQRMDAPGSAALAVMLGMQGVEIPELGALGGHLTEPPLAG